ncbi:MAG: ABC transporter substrate-binding protein [Solirubrobacterales bacterium]
MRPRVIALAAGLAAAAMALGAGCGGGNDNGGTSSTANPTATPGINLQADPKIVGELPADVKSSGELTVAADATYPPDEFIAQDGSTVIGMDADMAKAIAQLMGLTPKVQNVTFNDIIPGLAANRYDLGMSSFTDTKDREKVVDFVDYLTAGSAIFVKSGEPKITSLDGLCGHTVAAEKGTTQQDDIASQDEKCKSEGKPGVTGQILPDQNQVNLAVTSGRADAAMADSPVAAYIAEKSSGQLEVSGGPFPPEPYGIAIPKNTGLTQPVFDAVKTLIDNGTYTKILDYWGLQSGAIDQPSINKAVS